LRDRFRRELRQLPDVDQEQLLAVLTRVAAMMHAPPMNEGPFFFHER
jgi:hypothetical protein